MFLAESTVQLVPDGTLIIHVIFVVVMVAVLNRTLLKPINKILAEREDLITGRLNEAQELLRIKDQNVAEYQAALRDARSEGYQWIEKERAEAMRDKDEKVRTHKERIAQELTAQLESTRTQEDKVRSELEGQAKSLGDMITARVLRRS
jgi:F-type H+-transporting ATPase subunit b